MADYLSRLPQHAVFSRSATAVSPADPTTLVAVRASELLVLAGQELRLASLVDVKQGRQAGYRVRPRLFDDCPASGARDRTTT